MFHAGAKVAHGFLQESSNGMRVAVGGHLSTIGPGAPVPVASIAPLRDIQQSCALLPQSACLSLSGRAPPICVHQDCSG